MKCLISSINYISFCRNKDYKNRQYIEKLSFRREKCTLYRIGSTLSLKWIVIYKPNYLLMRTILFLFLVICLGTSTQAQEKLSVRKVEGLTMPVTNTLEKPDDTIQKFQTAARFFKVKNARVKQALLFIPRTRRTQVA